jgi:hypothetical protein
LLTLVLAALVAVPSVTAQPSSLGIGDRDGVLQAVMAELGLIDAELQVLEPERSISRSFTLPLLVEGVEYRVRLERRSLRSPDFRLLVQDETGEIVDRAPLPPRTYRGGDESHPGVRAAIHLTEAGQVRGLVDVGADGQFAVQPVTDVLPGAPGALHVVYRTEDTYPLGDFRCGTPEDFPPESDPGVPPGSGAVPFDSGIRICEIAFDADREFFQANGSSVSATMEDIEGVMNNVTFIYERDTSITFAITTILVRTSEPDPYSTSDPSGLLGQFQNHWNSNHQDIPRDVAHLMTGRDLSGGVIGIAQLGVICGTAAAYGLSQSRFSGNMTYRTGLTAHELGHNWSATHCSGSGCRIMCPTLGGCTGDVTKFGLGAIGQIFAFRESRTCLDELENPIPLPFVDTFPGETLDGTKWSERPGAAVAEFATNEPSEPFSLNLDSQGDSEEDQDEIFSKPLLLGGLSNVTLSYFTQPREVLSGNRLIIEYLGSDEAWNPVDTVTSSGGSEAHFRFRHHTLPANALHDGFRLRLRPDVDSPLEDWFVDNISICAANILISFDPQSSAVPAGGTLFFDATVSNITGQGQGAEAWISVTAPDGSPLFAGGNPKFGPKLFSLNPFQSKTKSSLRINVPADAPPGLGYRVVGVVGNLGSGIVQSAGEFAFEVTP